MPWSFFCDFPLQNSWLQTWNDGHYVDLGFFNLCFEKLHIPVFVLLIFFPCRSEISHSTNTRKKEKASWWIVGFHFSLFLLTNTESWALLLSLCGRFTTYQSDIMAATSFLEILTVSELPSCLPCHKLIQTVVLTLKPSDVKENRYVCEVCHVFLRD